MPLTREERKLIHHKSKQPTFGSGKPNKREGAEGDISFRKVEGSGTVQYLKEGDDWVAISATGSLPAIRLAATSGGASGGGGGVTSHSALGGLAVDDHLQYILHDGTRDFTGNQSFGGFNVTNVGDLDVDGHATLDQVTIDTADGAFSVDGANGTTINSTAGTLNIGNDADAFGINIGTAGQRIITLGNVTGSTALYHYAGTAGIGMGSQGEIQMDALGGSSKIRLDTDGGVIEIGVNDAAGNIDVGTDATARTITMGNITGATALNLNAGTGGIALASTGAGDITINSDDTLLLDADGVLELNTSGGAINIGTDAVAVNTTIGNVTGATGLALNAGTGGISLTSTGTGDIILTSPDKIDIDAGTANVNINSSAGEIKIGDDAVASKIWVGGDVATRTEVELNAILIDINAGTGGAKIDSTGVMQLDSDDTSNFRMDVNDAGNKTLSIRATNAGAGVGHLDIDADGDIDITAVSTLDLDSANGTWDATTLSIDSTDTTNISMNANAGSDKTLTIDAENAGVGLGKFELNADIITFETPYVATSDENQTNLEGSWNFTNNDDLSFYSTSVDTWINAKDNNLMIYSGFDMSLIVDGEQLYIKDTALNTVYTFDVGSSPALTVLAGASEPNGAPFLIENQGTDGDIKLRPMGGDLYIQSSGSNNTFRFNATTSQFLINNVFDNTLDPQITFTDDASGDIWSIGADVTDTVSDPKFKINSTATLSGTGDFELDKSGNGRFAGDLDVDGKNIVMGAFGQELNANITQKLQIENTKYGVHINEPWAYADAPAAPVEHYYDGWNVRTQLGDYDGSPLSQHLSGGYADFYNNYFIVGCFYEQAGLCVKVGKLYT